MGNVVRLILFLILMIPKSGFAEGIEVTVHSGLVNLQADELVYFGAHKVSELTWDTKSAQILGVDTSWKLKSTSELKLNVNFSTAVSKGDSVMDDYDWFLIGQDWTHWSHHEDTTLEKGLTYDLNISQPLYENPEGTIEFGALYGFKSEQWQWQARGGTYIYSSSASSLRDLSGTFPDVLGITYEQTMDTPYVGLDFKWRHNQFTVKTRVIGSMFVSSKAVDHHHLRDLVFTDTFKDGTMVSGDINILYHFSEHTTFSMFYSYMNYMHNRGDTFVYDQVTGQTSFFPNDAGMALKYNTFQVGATYLF